MDSPTFPSELTRLFALQEPHTKWMCYKIIRCCSCHYYPY